jgi:ABC-type transport system substrate-binding protein
MRSIRRTRDAAASATLVAIAAWCIASGVACVEALPAPLVRGHPDDPAPRRGGTLHIAGQGEPRGFDPAAAADQVSLPLVALLFDGLVDYDEHGQLVGVLAERWEVGDSGATYRFFLRPSVLFQDGEELTADDVRRSIERALHPDTPDPFASTFAGIVGYDDFAAGKAAHLAGVHVEGRYVVSIALTEPDAAFLASLTLPSLRPVCKSAGERYSPGWLPCGAGPFRLPEGGWQHGISITVVRNEHYFRAGRPYVDAITWEVGMPVLTQRFKFLAGDLDYYRDLSSIDVARFASDARWKALGDAEPDVEVTGEAMNTQMAPFDNVEVRRAVAAAIDREHYRLLSPATLDPANQPIPPAIPGFLPEFTGQTHDYAAALEHMRRAGYPYDPATGTGGYPKTVRYTAYEPGLAYYSAQVLQQELAKIGIRLEIRLLGIATWQALTHKAGRAEMTIGSWAQDYPDPSDFFEPNFAGSSIHEDDSNNVAFYDNPRLDALLKRARIETDGARRASLYAEATRIVCDDAPWAFVFYSHRYSVHQPYLRGYVPRPAEIEYMGDVWLDRPGATAEARAAGVLGSLFGQRAARLP